MSEHHHDHSHSHLDIGQVGKAFIWGIALNVVFVIIEAVVGYNVGSLALIADAGHNLADSFSLIIAFLAFKLASAKPTEKYTYGYKKSTILAAFTNAVILMLIVFWIVYEVIERKHTDGINGKAVIITAGIGIIINGVTALLFFRNREKDLNVKGAYLHLMADALVSVGVVISGVIIHNFPEFNWIDGLVSLVIALVIFISTWNLFKQTIRISLDGVPHSVDVAKVSEAIRKVSGIESIHHLHIWALSTTQNALTCHIVISKAAPQEQIPHIKSEIRHIAEHNSIQHCTLETEMENESCDDMCD